MVGYNVGGGGGGGSSGSDYKNDTLKPEFALEGYTFHAGENNNQQVGKIKNFDGKAVSGEGNGSQTIPVSTSVRHIPAGTYLAEDVKIAAPALESRTSLSVVGDDNYIPAGRYTKYEISPKFFSTEVRIESWTGKLEFDCGFEPVGFFCVMIYPEEYTNANDDHRDVITSIFYYPKHGSSVSADFQPSELDDEGLNYAYHPDVEEDNLVKIVGNKVTIGGAGYEFKRYKYYSFFAWA